MSENQTLHSAILSISHILPISLLNTWRLECLIVLPFYRVVKNAVPSWGLHVLQNNGGDSIRARDLQLHFWHVGNYMSRCFVFCNSSCSSVSFANLCVLWPSGSYFSKFCYSTPIISNYFTFFSFRWSQTLSSHRIFWSSCPSVPLLVSILIFHLPFFKSPYSVSILVFRSFELQILYTPPDGVTWSQQALRKQKFYIRFDW